MLMHSTIALAALTAVSSAFLLPDTITQVEWTLPFELAATGDGSHLQLDCPGCPVALKHADDIGPSHISAILWGAGPAFRSTLDLDIKVNHLEETDVITVNNVQLFPVVAPFSAGPLVAPQTKIDEDGKGSTGENVALGYNSAVRLVKPYTEKEPLALYKIRLSIVEVGDVFVQGIDTVELDVIATPAKGLLITDIKKVSSSPSSNSPLIGAECETLACKVKELIAAQTNRLQNMKPKHRGGCHGRKAGMMSQGYKGHHGHDNGEHKNGRHHHSHHAFGKFLHNLKNIALQVLIPISIGIATGMTASLLGMVVGHFIVSMWRFFVRGNTQGSCSYANAHREPLVDEKHYILVEEDEVPLPPYMDEVDEKSELV